MSIAQWTTPTFSLKFTEQALDLTQAENVYVTFKMGGYHNRHEQAAEKPV